MLLRVREHASCCFPAGYIVNASVNVEHVHVC